ncbi:MAG: hypothetical protein HWD60_00720 [Defluviicoccus sp.]|nr:MAG: hypothetical protein HWD60_00720 [Defluviicoccus sp.]
MFDADIGAQRERGTRTALRRHRTDLAALIYLARSDGHLHEGEADLVVEYIERIAEEPVDRTLIFRHLARLYPDWGRATMLCTTSPIDLRSNFSVLWMWWAGCLMSMEGYRRRKSNFCMIYRLCSLIMKSAW